MGRHLDRLSGADGALDSGRIFEITKNDDGTFAIYECCDHYFSEKFTADELRELGQEIIDIANSAAVTNGDRK